MGSVVERDPIAERLRPVLEQVQAKTGESVTLSKLQGLFLVYLTVVDSIHLVRPALSVGMMRPLHSAASGKALLSMLEPAARQQLVHESGFARLTPNTLRSHKEVEAQIAAGADRGWFSSQRESEAELSAVAVPLRIASDPYAITVLGTSHRMDDKLECHAKVLLAAKAAIEDTL